jgi:branched-chain amino acid transport system ATP-binding protein
MTTTHTIHVNGLEKSYQDLKVLRGVDFDVPRGSIFALLGSNGAGKTTVARVCSGLIKPTAGKMLFDGDDVTGQRPYRLARRGIAQAPEGRSVFASLTVEENLLLPLRRSLGRSGVSKGLQRAYELFPPLGERRRQAAGTLSGGEQRMLALARVLAKPPRLLVCDELSLGLAPIIVDEVYKTLRAIRESGTTLLIVEQHVGHALGIADDVAVLVKGRVTYDGPVAEMGDLSEWLLPTAGSVDVPSPNGH